RKGVVVKGGAALERLAKVDAVAFDKTGTLTEGRPEVGDLFALDPFTPEDLLRLAASAEQPSEHPLARTLVAEAQRLGLAPAQAGDFRAHPGAGVSARVKDGEAERAILVGNLRLSRELGVVVSPEVEKALATLDESGQTALLVAVDGRVAG